MSYFNINMKGEGNPKLKRTKNTDDYLRYSGDEFYKYNDWDDEESESDDDWYYDDDEF